MDSWFSLVLMCGLIIVESLKGAAGFAISDGRHGRHTPQNLINSVHSLEERYGLANKKWVGSAVFTPYLDKLETCTCEKLVLSAMLNSYVEIFSNMLKESNEIEGLLKGIQASVTQLRETKYSKEQRTLEQLQEIKLTNVKNNTIQLGAVKDFLSVYEKAITLGQRHQ